MRLAIGDIVRDRTDMSLGTVVRIGFDGPGGVVLDMPGRPRRLAFVDDLEIVSRYVRPPSGRFRLAAVVCFLAAVLASFIAGHSVQVLGGSWLLTAMAALGAYEIWDIGFRWARRLAGPRRFRV